MLAVRAGQYQGRSYASLLLQLKKWQSPTWTFVKDPGVETGHIAFEFPKSRNFQPCGLYSTAILKPHIVRSITNESGTLDELAKARDSAQSVALPNSVKSLVWKLEAGGSRQTEYQYMTARG